MTNQSWLVLIFLLYSLSGAIQLFAWIRAEKARSDRMEKSFERERQSWVELIERLGK